MTSILEHVCLYFLAWLLDSDSLLVGGFKTTTVKAGIIENDARTSRISPFGLGGEEDSLSAPHWRQGKRNDSTDLTRRGNSNGLAIFLRYVTG